MVTRKEVAAFAGVSEATVSRVFNNVGPLKATTRERVLAAARQLGYHPNAIASSFARRRSGNLGVVLPYVPKVHLFSTYFFSEVLSGISEAVRERGYDVLLWLRPIGESGGFASLFRSQKVDGCVILGASDVTGERDALREMAAEGMPFCLVNQHFDGEAFSVVDADHVKGSYEAVSHLLAGGCKRIAFLNGSRAYSNSLDRLTGFSRALSDAGLDPAQALILEGNYSRKSGYEAALAVRERIDGIDAVFAANDRMAVGLMQGLREYGIDPGHDIAVVGYDDSDASRVTDPPLTTVHVPFFEMGRLAASKLLRVIHKEDESMPFYEKLSTNLVIRKSSTRLRGRDGETG